jgi:hypothetical protein
MTRMKRAQRRLSTARWDPGANLQACGFKQHDNRTLSRARTSTADVRDRDKSQQPHCKTTISPERHEPVRELEDVDRANCRRTHRYSKVHSRSAHQIHAQCDTPCGASTILHACSPDRARGLPGTARLMVEFETPCSFWQMRRGLCPAQQMSTFMQGA